MDVMQELNKEIAKQIAEAYDKGCYAMLDKIIELCDVMFEDGSVSTGHFYSATKEIS